MASKMSRISLMKAIQARAYSQAVPSSGYASSHVETTVLPNKMIVASAENSSPICRVSIQVLAGSRNEAPDNSGASHVLRAAAGMSTKKSSQFAITRHIQQVGASLMCTSDREIISYTLEGTCKAVEEMMPYLATVVTDQVFKPWELADQVPRLKLELATRPPQQRAVDLLHKAAYRTGLGNSIYISKHQLPKINGETLQHYVASNFSSNRTAVVGLGIDHSSLCQYAQQLSLQEGAGSVEPASYKGGEIRSDKGGDYAFVAIATESAGMKCAEEALAFQILQKALGDGVPMKFSSNSSGILGKALGGGNYAVSAMNPVYSDSGLFGVLIAAKAKKAGSIVCSAVNALKSPNITAEDVNRAKNQLKFDVISRAECGSDAIDLLGKQALVLGNIDSVEEMICAIDAVSNEAVTEAACKVASGKLSIAAVGNLTTVPFLDEL